MYWLVDIVLSHRIAAVKRVLLTGMSGTGKSSVIQAPPARGFKATDTDDGWCEPLPDGRQRWREEAIGQLLGTEDGGMLFVAGCEEDQVRFLGAEMAERCHAEPEVLCSPAATSRFFTSLTNHLQAGCTVLASICCTGVNFQAGVAEGSAEACEGAG
jgi:hypothetical protein